MLERPMKVERPFGARQDEAVLQAKGRMGGCVRHHAYVARPIPPPMPAWGGKGTKRRLYFKAIQILQSHGIIADKYVLSPHSVNLFVPVGSREAAVKALHSLI
jgi:hypothetical protein